MNNIYVTAILPAHNEEEKISRAINSIKNYVDNIIVACDNCNDNTFSVAKNAGANIVFNTINNNSRKAGALNQALYKYANFSISNHYFLVMDADTEVINPELWFNKAASLVYPNRPKLNASIMNMNPVKKSCLKLFNYDKYKKLFFNKAYDCVGSIFKAPKKVQSNLEEGQNIEWLTYAGKVERSQKVFVLTGTCSLISAEMLKKVYIYNKKQYFYNESSVTEDFEITIILKEVGARLISPSDCQCYTETKKTVKDLLNQRRRWYLGGIELVSERKIDKIMFTYVIQQIMLSLSVFAYILFIALSLYLYLSNNIALNGFWLIVGIIFIINQVIRTWKFGNWFDRFYAMSMIGALWYSLILQIAYLWALESYIDKHSIYWNSHKKDQW